MLTLWPKSSSNCIRRKVQASFNIYSNTNYNIRFVYLPALTLPTSHVEIIHFKRRIVFFFFFVANAIQMEDARVIISYFSKKVYRFVSGIITYVGEMSTVAACSTHPPLGHCRVVVVGCSESVWFRESVVVGDCWRLLVIVGWLSVLPVVGCQGAARWSPTSLLAAQ